MLLAKINPAASFVTTSSPFTPPSTANADYLTAIARPYAVGSEKTNFEVNFLSATLDDNQAITDVTNVGRVSVLLTSEDMASWGTDDSVLLGIIATKLGTTVVSTVTFDDPGFGFPGFQW